MKEPKTFTVLVPLRDFECLDWCWNQFGTPEFLIQGASARPSARWSYSYCRSEIPTIQLIFFAEADYQLFKDTDLETWSWLKYS